MISLKFYINDRHHSAAKQAKVLQVNRSVAIEAMASWCRSFSVSPTASEHMICCPLSTWSSSAMRWNKEGISPSWLIFRHPKDVSKEAPLTLPYSVDERLGVCHLMDVCISHTINASDAKHDPVRGCGESIHLVFHVDYRIQDSHSYRSTDT